VSDFAGALRVARLSIGGASATSRSDARKGRESNSVLLFRCFRSEPWELLPVENAVAVEGREDLDLEDEDGRDGDDSASDFASRFVVVDTEVALIAARTVGRKSASILLQSEIIRELKPGTTKNRELVEMS
jgi:hypothetical protein